MGEEDVEFDTEWLAGKIGIPKDMVSVIYVFLSKHDELLQFLAYVN